MQTILLIPQIYAGATCTSLLPCGCSLVRSRASCNFARQFDLLLQSWVSVKHDGTFLHHIISLFMDQIRRHLGGLAATLHLVWQRFKLAIACLKITHLLCSSSIHGAGGSSERCLSMISHPTSTIAEGKPTSNVSRNLAMISHRPFRFRPWAFKIC